jgi:ACR3 family arsenite efflux pump ArsB
MKLKSLDKGGLIVIFINGGLFGFTDYNGPRDIVTFIGSALVVMVVSLGAGWVINKILNLIPPYRIGTEKIRRQISPIVIIGLIVSFAILIYGTIELISY